MREKRKALTAGKPWVFICAGLVMALIVTLLSGFSSSATARGPVPASVSQASLPTMLLPAHRVRTKMQVRLGVRIGFGPYGQVKMNRSQSYKALRLYRSAAGATRDAGLFICALCAAATPYAAVACLAVFLRSAADVRAM